MLHVKELICAIKVKVMQTDRVWRIEVNYLRLKSLKLSNTFSRSKSFTVIYICHMMSLQKLSRPMTLTADTCVNSENGLFSIGNVFLHSPNYGHCLYYSIAFYLTVLINYHIWSNEWPQRLPITTFDLDR